MNGGAWFEQRDCGESLVAGHVRIGNRLNSVVPGIHKQFDISGSQARKALQCGSRQCLCKITLPPDVHLPPAQRVG